ncbi:MAG: hypothetical protein MdMp014T_0236 [Treponematales bacterium]
MEVAVEFDRAAFRHKLGREDILHAFRVYLYDGPIEGEGYEEKYLRLGIDPAGNPLEIVYHEIDERTVLIFHAMKCRSKYFHLLP